MKNDYSYTDQSQLKPSTGGAVNFFKELLIAGSGNATSTGLKWGVGTVLTKTVFRRLPAPLNFVVPIVAEKLITKETIDGGREILLKGLRWVKKMTDDKSATTIQQYNKF